MVMNLVKQYEEYGYFAPLDVAEWSRIQVYSVQSQNSFEVNGTFTWENKIKKLFKNAFSDITLFSIFFPFYYLDNNIKS